MKAQRTVTFIGAIAAVSAATSAGVITFDEFPPMGGKPVTSEYAGIGVNFWNSGAIWGGFSDGDPGGWGIDGSNGSQFMVVEGGGSVNIRFDQPVSHFSMDMTLLSGNGSGLLSVVGYLREEVLFASGGGISPEQEWSTWSRDIQIDSIEFLFQDFGTGLTFAVDNINWTTVPAPGSFAVFAAAGVAAIRRRRR